ncbi:MAG: glycosyltransferase, partial [Chromatiales bacterium]|nr:glycosyltransferase [Chromatiales bacterium]
MTRVVHVISSLHTGGAEAMLAQLVLAKRSRSITFTVVSMTPGGEHRERLEHAGVDVCDLGMTRGRPDPRALLALTRILRDRRPDVVQSWMYHADLLSLLAFKLARLPKSRLYWGVRCSDMDVTAYPAQLRWTIKACARAAKFVDGVVANSFAGRDHHLALGYKPPAFPVVVNGIDVARFAPSTTARNAVRADLGIDDKAVVVINVARVDPMKGHDHLLAALGTVPAAQGLLVGAGTESLSTTGCLGLGRRDDVPALLAAAD